MIHNHILTLYSKIYTSRVSRNKHSAWISNSKKKNSKMILLNIFQSSPLCLSPNQNNEKKKTTKPPESEIFKKAHIWVARCFASKPGNRFTKTKYRPSKWSDIFLLGISFKMVEKTMDFTGGFCSALLNGEKTYNLTYIIGFWGPLTWRIIPGRTEVVRISPIYKPYE